MKHSQLKIWTHKKLIIFEDNMPQIAQINTEMNPPLIVSFVLILEEIFMRNMYNLWQKNIEF